VKKANEWDTQRKNNKVTIINEDMERMGKSKVIDVARNNGEGKKKTKLFSQNPIPRKKAEKR